MGNRGSFPGVKRLGREADHSPPSNAEVKVREDIPPFSQYAFTALCSVKAQGQINLYLNIIGESEVVSCTAMKTQGEIERINFGCRWT
jgi:hypothetical protein